MTPSADANFAGRAAAPELTWNDPAPPDPTRLDNIKTQLDVVLLALESLTGLGSESMLKAAQTLGLEELIGDRVSLWRLRQSNPIRRGSGGRKKLDVEEARSLVLITCHLAAEHGFTIRQAVNTLEQLAQEQRPPHYAPQLGDYLDRFTTIYEERMDTESMNADALGHLALKLLIDLLFYSSPQGPRRLWMSLLDCPGGTGNSPPTHPQSTNPPSAKMKPS
jgi:hypothetical protein